MLGLHVYHPIGFPATGEDQLYVDAAIAGGASVVELGFPFSDPSADGPVLQQATRRALQGGATFQAGVDLIRETRRRHPRVGIVAMAYANALHAHGWDAAASALARAGADGVIVPDLPLREARRLLDGLHRQGLPWIPVVTATVPDATLLALGETRPPFIYAASLGVTGQAGPGQQAVDVLRRLRALSPSIPVVVGFGIRTAEDVRAMRDAGAHGVVVGSALVRAIQDGRTPDEHSRQVRALAQAYT